MLHPTWLQGQEDASLKSFIDWGNGYVGTRKVDPYNSRQMPGFCFSCILEGGIERPNYRIPFLEVQLPKY